MAEISLVSSVAGLISLGLQLTGGIIQYYSAYKNRTDEIKQATEFVSQLRSSLLTLDTSLASLKSGPARDQAIAAISSCGEGLKVLSQSVDKLRVSDSRGGKTWSATLRDKSGRLLYPFRQRTLIDLRRTVAELLLSLTPALDSVELSLGNELLVQIENFRSESQAWRLNQETRSILDWLSTLSFRQRQQDLSSKRHSGTGKWLLTSERFRSWQDASNIVSPGLWCVGEMGSGKSVLMSTVVQSLQETNPGDDFLTCYLYCDWQSQGEQTIAALAGNILRQILEDLEEIPATVKVSFEASQKGRVSLRIPDIVGLIRECAGSYKCVYLCVDALDESRQPTPGQGPSNFWSMERLVDSLIKPGTSNVRSVRAFTTTRFSIPADIQSHGTFLTVEMDTPLSEISGFVREQLSDPDTGSWTSPELGAEIQTMDAMIARASDAVLEASNRSYV